MAPRYPGPSPVHRPGGVVRPRDPMQTLLGLVLVVPAGLAALVSLVVPAVQTILRSFQSARLLRDPVPTGLDNYTGLLGDGEFWTALVFSLSLAIVPLVVAVVVAPLLAAALDRAGTGSRRVGRVLMSVPLVTFSPVAVAVAWLLGQRGDGIATVFGSLSLADRAEARWTVPLAAGMATFGAVCGLALLVFLAVLRGRGTGRPVTPLMAAVAAITALTVFAVSLQAFSLTFTMTRGGPARSTETLALLQFGRAFTTFDLGAGATVATVTGLLLGALGVAATLIAVIFALRIELTPSDRATATSAGTPARPGGPGGTLVAVAALVVVVVVAVTGAWPWLSALWSTPDGVGAPSPSVATARTYANTWVPPFLGALVSIGTAYLAALGIGGLRPLGRRSEWLLLPFAPWLFVGIGPLSVAGFENARSLHTIDTFIGLVPPLALSVPALVVLTLFCRGQSARWNALRAAGAPSAMTFLRVVAVPALPLAVLSGGALVMINAQGLLWPLLVGASREHWTAPVTLAQTMAAFGTRNPPVGITTPLVVIVIALIALAALQIFYLDRLAITSDRVATTGRVDGTDSVPSVPGPPPGSGNDAAMPRPAPPPGPVPRPAPPA